ncbi:MAG: hypothetical protein J6T54_06235 [Fibrobacter sp.]|nr:hypothetical protein [Fibrobacter sp.]
MNTFKYYLSLVILIVLVLLDVVFIITLIASVASGNIVGAVVVGLLLFLPLLLLTKEVYSYYKKIDKKIDSGKTNSEKSVVEARKNDEPDKQIKSVEIGRPEYEIVYTDHEGEKTTRKISVLKFDGRLIDAFCFLRGEERTFYVKRISECIDLSTGEVINGDLRQFFADKFNMKLKPCEMYSFDEWVDMVYSPVPELPTDLHGFELNEKFNMTIATFNDGFINDEFVCEKVYSSSYISDQFYVSMYNRKGLRFNVGLSKIVSVDGIDNFGKYLESKFYESDIGKACVLLQKFPSELSILVYLGRADTSLTANKRQIICAYLNGIGAETSDDVVSKAIRRIKIDTAEFKKIVGVFSKFIPEDGKNSFVEAAEKIIGGRAKAKPFGLAGLQYIESKFK